MCLKIIYNPLKFCAFPAHAVPGRSGAAPAAPLHVRSAYRALNRCSLWTRHVRPTFVCERRFAQVYGRDTHVPSQCAGCASESRLLSGEARTSPCRGPPGDSDPRLPVPRAYDVPDALRAM
jgi:hypothetical protein